MNTQVKLHGRPDKYPSNLRLRAGPLAMEFEKDALRNIRYGGQEVIRMIYPAVRDVNWLTLSPVTSTLQLDRWPGAFLIRFENQYTYQDINFRASFLYTGMTDGRLTVEMRGLALSTFMQNRIGFCVLHPAAGCSGRECTIYHPDGTATVSCFPDTISPWQPFRNISGMQWKTGANLEGLLRFEGNVFETEDQRNWTDASYKTYSTPLDIPYPVKLAEGDTMHQTVAFELRGIPPGTGSIRKNVVVAISRDSPLPLPDIGITATSRNKPMAEAEGRIIGKLGFSHLRADIYLFRDDAGTQLERIRAESSLTGLPVELCLFFGHNPVAELTLFLDFYRKSEIRLKSLLVLDETEKVTPPGLLAVLLPLIRKEIRDVPVGTGTNCNFAQINRSRPDPGLADFIVFPIHPQEHASDNRTLVENTEAQGCAVQCAMDFEGHRPVHVSPVTLKRRFNANTTNFEVPFVDAFLPPQVDPSQMSLFGAAWTIGSLASLLGSGAGSLTYYETVGERGICMGAGDSRWPLQFQARKGMVFPVFHVFRMLFQYPAYRVLKIESSHPLRVNGFALAGNKKGMIFLSNMTNQNQQITLEGCEKYRLTFAMHRGNFDRITRDDAPDVLKVSQWFSSNSVPVNFRPFETLVLEFMQ